MADPALENVCRPTNESDIAALAAEVRAFCGARDWDQFHGPKDLAIATEAAELLEPFRFATAEDLADAVRAKLAENGKRYPVEQTSVSHRKAP